MSWINGKSDVSRHIKQYKLTSLSILISLSLSLSLSLSVCPFVRVCPPVIGVAQVGNKRNKRAFNSHDIKAFEAFALFCGLGIHNAMLYDKVMKLNLRSVGWLVGGAVVVFHPLFL